MMTGMIAAAGIFGLIVGSFLNVVIYRLPLHQSIAYPASHCSQCGQKIRAYDNIPVISFILLRGRCRSCHERIPLRYPLVELITGLIAAVLYLRYGLTVELAAFFLLSAGLVAIAFIDLDHGIIPNTLSYPGTIAGLVFSFFLRTNTPLAAVAGILAGAGILFATAFLYKAATGVEGMGMGDVKLMAMIGAFLGWQAALFTIILSALIGALAGVGLVVFAGKGRKFAMPYGPFIAAAALVYLFYGQPLITAYLRIMGYA